MPCRNLYHSKFTAFEWEFAMDKALPRCKVAALNELVRQPSDTLVSTQGPSTGKIKNYRIANRRLGTQERS